jgi:O-antigen/teichoic acid export membrane protein
MVDGGTDYRDAAPADAGDPRDLASRIRLVRESALNCAPAAISALTSLALVPIMLHRLGAESYGIWIACLTAANVATLADFGLGWSVTREVACANGAADGPGRRTLEFVNAASGVFLALGLAGGLGVAGAARVLVGAMCLSVKARALLPWASACAGVFFLGTNLWCFARALLSGLRRFGLIALISVSWIIVSAVATVAALMLGLGLPGVAGVQAAVALSAGGAGLAMAVRAYPELRPAIGGLRWSTLAPHVRFGAFSQLVSWTSYLIWQAPPMVAGLLLGAPAVAFYHVGQKFPLLLTRFTDSGGEVAFAAISESRPERDPSQARLTVDRVARALLVVETPLCLMVWFMAPAILRLWVGGSPQVLVVVMRVTTLAVMLDALSASFFLYLWINGGFRRLLAVELGVGAATLALGAAMLATFGATGAAWGLAVASAGGCAALICSGCADTGRSPWDFLRSAGSGLALASGLCALGLYASLLVVPGSLGGLLGAATLSGALYCGALYWTSREEERRLVRELVRVPFGFGPGARERARALLDLEG